MKKILILDVLLMCCFCCYGQDWYFISKKIHKIELKQKVFRKKKRWNKKMAGYFFKLRNSFDFLKMSNCQIGDTLYLNEYTSVDGSKSIDMIDSKRDFRYFIDDYGTMVKEVTKCTFEKNAYREIILRWDYSDMQRLSDAYPKEVFDGGTNHFFRIILEDEKKSKIEFFVTNGFALKGD